MASLSTSPEGPSTPQCPWSVYSSRQRSAISTSSSPMAARSVRSATCTTPSGSQAPLPCGVLVLGHAEEDQTRERRARPAAWPRPPRSRACAGPRRAWRRWARGRSTPSRTKSGATRSSTLRRASATKAAKRRRAAHPAQAACRKGVGHHVNARRRRRSGDRSGRPAPAPSPRPTTPRLRRRWPCRPPGPPPPCSARCTRHGAAPARACRRAW